jgi:hypothetical protein
MMTDLCLGRCEMVGRGEGFGGTGIDGGTRGVMLVGGNGGTRRMGG